MKFECEKCPAYEVLNKSIKLNQELRKKMFKDLGFDLTVNSIRTGKNKIEYVNLKN